MNREEEWFWRDFGDLYDRIPDAHQVLCHLPTGSVSLGEDETADIVSDERRAFRLVETNPIVLSNDDPALFSRCCKPRIVGCCLIEEIIMGDSV